MENKLKNYFPLIRGKKGGVEGNRREQQITGVVPELDA